MEYLAVSIFRLSLNISCVKVGDLDEKTIQWAFELTKRNMEVL